MKNELQLLIPLLVLSCASGINQDFPLNSRILNTTKPTIKLALGSCHDSSRLKNDSMIFKSIRDVEPDLFIWLGDAVYLDRGLEKRWNWKTMGYDRIERGFQEKRQIFDKTKRNDREYRKLRESVPIIGVWDDHDFGMDD